MVSMVRLPPQVPQSDTQHSFPNVRIGLMAGIGGGTPSIDHDIWRRENIERWLSP